jgi:hypothetical protein
MPIGFLKKLGTALTRPIYPGIDRFAFLPRARRHLSQPDLGFRLTDNLIPALNLGPIRVR